jgi:transcriptional antiterminator NusG
MSDEESLPEDAETTPVDGAEQSAAEVQVVDDADGSSEDASAKPEVELSPEDLEFSADEIITDEDDEWGDDDEDASPIEEFVEPVKEVKASDLEMNWYILKVQVNREKGICETLKRSVRVAGMQDFFGDILVPTEDVREFNKAGKPKITKRKLYPGYIVVNMAITDESWFLVRDTSGIGDFAGAAGRPSPLSQEEIDRIIAAARPPKGEDVEDQIKTTIPFFGRPNPVDMEHWHVEMVK